MYTVHERAEKFQQLMSLNEWLWLGITYMEEVCG